MAHMFIGHISFARKDWGRVYFGPNYPYFTAGYFKKSLPHQEMLFWRTLKTANLDKFELFDKYGGGLGCKERKALMGTLKEWGDKHTPHIQEYLTWVVEHAQSLDFKDAAAKRITDQNILQQLVTSHYNWCVRTTAIKYLTDKVLLEQLAHDDIDTTVRFSAKKRLRKLGIQQED